MFSANAYVIRFATPEEAQVLGRPEHPGARPTDRVLVGEISGRPAAALLADGRVVSDPFQPTSHLVAYLRLRAGALQAYERTPSLRERLRAGVRMSSPTPSVNA